MRAAERAAGVDAVDDLARRADRAVEAELARELLDDLLQRRRDDVDGLAALAVPGDELERLLVDERLQNRLHRGRDEVAEVVDAEALQDHQAVLRRLAHGLGARAARGEEELPGGGLGELAASDHAVLAERPGERERARAPQQRAVEVEEGSGAGHASSLEVARQRAGVTSPSQSYIDVCRRITFRANLVMRRHTVTPGIVLAAEGISAAAPRVGFEPTTSGRSRRSTDRAIAE